MHSVWSMCTGGFYPDGHCFQDYTEKKHQFDSNNLKSLKNGQFKDIVGPAVSARAMMIEQPLMTKMYGSDSLEDIANVMNSVRTLS